MGFRLHIAIALMGLGWGFWGKIVECTEEGVEPTSRTDCPQEAQKARFCLIGEYTLNHTWDPSRMWGIFPH